MLKPRALSETRNADRGTRNGAAANFAKRLECGVFTATLPSRRPSQERRRAAASQGGLATTQVKGEGVPKDKVAAEKWFNLSAAGGDTNSA